MKKDQDFRFRGGKGYISAIGALYGEAKVSVGVSPPKKNKRRKTLVAKEAEEQFAFVSWLIHKGVLFHSVPNEGAISPIRMNRLKRMGLQAGVPDLVIPIRRGQYGACYIEMKRVKGGRLSDAQRSFISRLISAGNFVYIAEGADIAISVVEEYLSGRNVTCNLGDY